jgi:hypothetical protein
MSIFTNPMFTTGDRQPIKVHIVCVQKLMNNHLKKTQFMNTFPATELTQPMKQAVGFTIQSGQCHRKPEE